MSDSAEPSYYEIALTGRQVLAAFVIVLVCLLTAFFSGVWVGRDAGIGDDESPMAALEGEIGAAGDGVEELSFFEEAPRREQPDLAEVAREQRPDTTLREDVEATPAPAERLEDPPREARQPPANEDAGTGAPERREPAREASEPASRRPEPARDAVPEETEDDEAAGTGPRNIVSSDLPATGDLVIQVFTSSEEAKARDVLQRLSGAGFRAFISPVVSENRTLYRVRVGPFERRAAAEAEAERIRSALALDTWITQ